MGISPQTALRRYAPSKALLFKWKCRNVLVTRHVTPLRLRPQLTKGGDPGIRCLAALAGRSSERHLSGGRPFDWLRHQKKRDLVLAPIRTLKITSFRNERSASDGTQ